MATDFKSLLKQYSENAYAQIGLLVALLLFYVLTKNSFFGILFAIALIGTVAVEIWIGSNKRGWKEELKDTVISLVAIVILWFAREDTKDFDTGVTNVGDLIRPVFYVGRRQSLFFYNC